MMPGPSAGSPGLVYAEVAPPGPGERVRVADGVYWIRMPLPMELDHINLWLIEHEDGLVLVDTGLATQAARDSWEQLERGPLASVPLRLIVLTHVHPDHVGLAAWLEHRHRVPVWTSLPTDEQMRQLFAPGDADRARQREAFLQAHGLEDTAPLRPNLSGARYRSALSGLPPIASHPSDGLETLWQGRPWCWLRTDGHASGHLCLSAPSLGVLISGDQVLPTISPNVSLSGVGSDPDPLRSYLESLERLSRLDAHTLVLPSHGRPFHGLRERAAELSGRHERQLSQLRAACQEPRSAYEILGVLFRRSLSGFHLLLAMGEAIAHLEYLSQARRLERLTETGGRIRYRAVPD